MSLINNSSTALQHRRTDHTSGVSTFNVVLSFQVNGGWAPFAHDVVSLLTALQEPSARKVKDQVERMLESVGVKRDLSARLQAIMALPRHRGTIEKHVSGHCSSASSVE
jgi:hypothetical protein